MQWGEKFVTDFLGFLGSTAISSCGVCAYVIGTVKSLRIFKSKSKHKQPRFTHMASEFCIHIIQQIHGDAVREYK